MNVAAKLCIQRQLKGPDIKGSTANSWPAKEVQCWSVCTKIGLGVTKGYFRAQEQKNAQSAGEPRLSNVLAVITHNRINLPVLPAF